MQPWATTPPENHKVYQLSDGLVFIHETAEITAECAIGRFSYISKFSAIGGKYPVKIGNFCSIAPELYCITAESHQTIYPTMSPLNMLLGLDLGYPEAVEKPQGVTLGHDVWIGHQVRLMPGITIGNGVAVGARAVVTKDLEPYGIYAGVPARLVRMRFSDPVIAALQDIKWWDWPTEKIMRNKAFFDLKLTEIEDVADIYSAIVD